MESGPVIEAVDTFILDIPLERPHVMSFGSPREVNFTLVRMEAQGGVIGWGEAATFQGPTWSEESAETIQVIIDRYLAPSLKGRNALHYNPLMAELEDRCRGNPFAKAAVEMALLDLAGRYLGQPLYVLLGGAFRRALDLSWSLASGKTETDLAEAREMMARGHRIFKIKMGAGSEEEDVAKFKLLRRELGPAISLRADVNQGWDRRTALRAIQELEDSQPEFLEQPLPRWDLSGPAYLRQKTSIPLMADESLTDEHSAMEIIRHGAADIFSYKLTKLGGMIRALAVYRLAAAAGLGSYIGCMIETSLGTAAYLQFGAALPRLDYGCELFGPLLLDGDIASKPIEYAKGQVLVPQGPGLGIEVDEAQVEKYRRRWDR
jgi:muconate cycloisomerase